MDVVIEGKALLERGLVDCCIGVDDGKIVKIAKTIDRADRRWDFSDKIVMPAGIDLHVHFREPGMTSKETFESGSAAAACGGISYVLDMPNTRPPTRSLADLQEKMSLASRSSYVDFGLAALLDPKTDIEEMAARASAFKIYLGETTGDLGIAPESLGPLLTEASGSGRPVMIHAEHLGPLQELTEKSLEDHDRRRSERLEMDAAKKVIESKPANAKIHLLHVTQENILSMAKKDDISVEVTPHHLLLDTGSPLGTFGKINPPLRSKSTRMRLWEAFAHGKADTLGSDHSPHTIAEKELEFNFAPSGMPGVETLIPLMLQKVAEKKLDIAILSRCSSSKPAEIIGAKKGMIKVGFDADLIAVDLRRQMKISADNLHSKCGWTPYEGMEAVFPVVTFIRGEEIARDGQLSGERLGRFIESEADGR